MNYLTLKNVPYVPYATVVNNGLICEYLQNSNLEHEEKKDNGCLVAMGKGYFLQESIIVIISESIMTHYLICFSLM